MPPVMIFWLYWHVPTCKIKAKATSDVTNHRMGLFPLPIKGWPANEKELHKLLTIVDASYLWNGKEIQHLKLKLSSNWMYQLIYKLDCNIFKNAVSIYSQKLYKQLNIWLRHWKMLNLVILKLKYLPVSNF